MVKEFTCIICPNGCTLTAEVEPRGDGTYRVRSLEGAACPRGTAYGQQELTDPRRTIATSVRVEGGELPLASVRLTAPIPKGKIFAAMEEIRSCSLTAPVEAGTVVLSRLLGYDADVIVTKSVAKACRPERALWKGAG